MREIVFLPNAALGKQPVHPITELTTLFLWTVDKFTKLDKDVQYGMYWGSKHEGINPFFFGLQITLDSDRNNKTRVEIRTQEKKTQRLKSLIKKKELGFWQEQGKNSIQDKFFALSRSGKNHDNHWWLLYNLT